MTAHEPTPSDAGIYPSQDPIELGAYYTRHIEAMTALRLHDKADIAEQLAWRDREIHRLRAHEIEQGRGALPELPPLPQCWSGSPVKVTWAEDGETSTREVYTADDMRAYAIAYGEACRRMGNRDE